jgi:hypothetical protein
MTVGVSVTEKGSKNRRGGGSKRAEKGTTGA